MSETIRYDHYKVLGVERSASLRQIKQAYRALVKRCHPDRNPAPQAASLFHAVHRAYEELSDPVRRRNYDERLRHYRPLTTCAAPPVRPHSTNYRTARDRPVNRFAFIGLHITGLCFGVTLVTGILLGITFFAWPSFTLVFCALGLAIIPDSLSGLRLK
ncbi:MAG: J domain-containing protein [Flavobacteriales bacterium]|jgi:hypothetical protein|nr:J domain-containing protein [Flavobacteriales bacterium]MBK6549448.1 J domain-containing protein [Flavobacteriales bacterium]MBK6883966.1 J domain-containing protein [Flavobacteriales bacterium]MBK7100356.1 J domain-containing protein [Flavobacteriales bacterium]MBK7111050.1 J domain-containing protein [Flavobacteriales bacterium]